jgi:hypothetical protein
LISFYGRRRRILPPRSRRRRRKRNDDESEMPKGSVRVFRGDSFAIGRETFISIISSSFSSEDETIH